MHAGRLALPVRIELGGTAVAMLDLVLDGERAEALRTALDAHLRGHGAPERLTRRSRAQLL